MPNSLFHLQFPTPELPTGSTFHTFFESLDGFKQQVAGAGTITLDEYYVTLKSGATQFGYARIYKIPSEPIVPLTWNKERTIESMFWIVSPAGGVPTIYITTGSVDGSYGFGFILLTRDLKGWCQNGGAASLVTLESFPAGALNIERRIKAILTPGLKVEFYIDGVKINELTTNIPQDTPHAARIIELKTYNDSTINEELYVSEFSMYQKD